MFGSRKIKSRYQK